LDELGRAKPLTESVMSSAASKTSWPVSIGFLTIRESEKIASSCPPDPALRLRRDQPHHRLLELRQKVAVRDESPTAQ